MPWSSSSQAPTATVSDSTATEKPKLSLGAPSEAVSLAFSLQAPDSRMKTYAAPEPLPARSLLCSLAPITAVLPSRATEYPNQSPRVPSEAASSTASSVSASVHPSSGLVNM